MQELEGRVAVVTGAAGGVGLGIAEALADARMRVVLADVDEAEVTRQAERLRRGGADVQAATVDVGDPDAVDAFAERLFGELGAVHVLVNNAGVQSPGVAWEQPLEAWRRLFDVNLWGPIHGMRSFVPRMLASGEPGHVLFTASVASINPLAGLAPYITSKHAVLGLADTLRLDLEAAAAPITVSSILPGLVQNRRRSDRGMDPRALGDVVVDGIRRDRPYIFTNAFQTERVDARLAEIMAARVR